MHSCFELVICLSGEMQITVDENEQNIREGEALLIFPHQLHSFSQTKGRIMVCIFSPKLVSAYYNPRSALKPVSNKFSLDGEYVSRLDGYEDNGKTLYIKGLLYLICDSFDSVAKYVENANKSLLEKIFMFVGENFSGECSLQTVAANVGYNASYISRYFKKCVGINLCDYITMVRLGNVCYLYENSDGTLLAFALDSGFDSLRTFNRNFKKFYGTSPKNYLTQK